MLKMPVPTRIHRFAGRAVLAAIVLSGSFAVYAAQSTPTPHRSSADAVKEALVLFDGAKMAVADYWSHHGYQLPVDNASARLPDASLIVGKYVDSVQFADGRLNATLRASAGGGHVVLVSMPDAEHAQMRWRCESPDIPKIASLDKGCAYVPAAASVVPSGYASMTLDLMVSVGGQPPHLHSTTCLKGSDDAYHFVLDQDKTLSPWKGQVGAVQGPDGQVEVHARLSGGSLAGPATPIVRMHFGQKAAIQIGKVVAGVDHTLRLDIAAWPGCGAALAVADDGAVHERFSGPSARLMAGQFAFRAGLTLLAAADLDNTRAVAGNFKGVPPREAPQLIGVQVGMKPEFSGQTVRFVAQ